MSGSPDFPFCLCWANENWTRRWDGLEREVLLDQRYSLQDDLSHIRWLLRAFADPRYIRVQGKPLFIVYRPGDLPSPLKTSDIWREEALKAGVGEIFLCGVATNFKGSPDDPRDMGFDGLLEFQPTAASRGDLLTRLWAKARYTTGKNVIIDYSRFAEWASIPLERPFPFFRSLVPGWDNSPRRKSGAFILHNSTPEKYAEWLEKVIRQSQSFSHGEKLVFINAWNEWGEGNHLEPCQRWGRRYLEETLSVLNRQSEERTSSLALGLATSETP